MWVHENTFCKYGELLKASDSETFPQVYRPNKQKKKNKKNKQTSQKYWLNYRIIVVLVKYTWLFM